jgi:large subunit ribosomal protein L18
MKDNKLVLYRRKREGRTNYKKRLDLLKSRKPRIVIRRTNTQMLVQITEYAPDGDKVIVGVNSNELKKLGWLYSCNNMPACYLAGILIGKKAKAKKVTEAIADFGLQSNIPQSKLYAVIKGAIDAGLNIPADPEVLPKKERLTGAHIADYFSKSKGNNQFVDYKKKNINVSNIAADVEELKKKIMQ